MLKDSGPGRFKTLRNSAPLCVSALESEWELNAEVQRTPGDAEKKLNGKNTIKIGIDPFPGQRVLRNLDNSAIIHL